MAKPTDVWPPPPTQGMPEPGQQPAGTIQVNTALLVGVLSLLTFVWLIGLPLAGVALIAGLRDKHRSIYSKIGMGIGAAVLLGYALLALLMLWH